MTLNDDEIFQLFELFYHYFFAKIIKRNEMNFEVFLRNELVEEKQLYLDYKVFLLDLFVDEIFSLIHYHRDKYVKISDRIYRLLPNFL